MKTKKYTDEEYKARRYAQSRQWALDNPERTRGYGRDFYQRNKEKRKAYSRKYNELHKEERKAYRREYYHRKKAEDPFYIKKLNERKKKKRQGNNMSSLVPTVSRNSVTGRKRKTLTPEEKYEKLVRACRKTLNEYLYKSLERDRAVNAEKIQEYFARYPFDSYAEGAIKRRLGRLGIYKNKAMYDDCYDAGVMAYMYSIHRCGASGYDYFLPYMYKMIRIYILCALIIYNDSKNICKINGMKQICIDKEENMKKY